MGRTRKRSRSEKATNRRWKVKNEQSCVSLVTFIYSPYLRVVVCIACILYLFSVTPSSIIGAADSVSIQSSTIRIFKAQPYVSHSMHARAARVRKKNADERKSEQARPSVTGRWGRKAVNEHWRALKYPPPARVPGSRD